MLSNQTNQLVGNVRQSHTPFATIWATISERSIVKNCTSILSLPMHSLMFIVRDWLDCTKILTKPNGIILYGPLQFTPSIIINFLAWMSLFVSWCLPCDQPPHGCLYLRSWWHPWSPLATNSLPKEQQFELFFSSATGPANSTALDHRLMPSAKVDPMAGIQPPQHPSR